MAWGFCILTLSILTALNATEITEKFGLRIPSDTHKKVAALYPVVKPNLQKLEDVYYSNQNPSNLRVQKNKISEEIRADIEKICRDCQLKSFYPDSGYEVNAYSSYLEKRMEQKSTEENNQTYTIAGICSLLGTVFCAYLIVGLVRFRNNFQKACILISVGIPIVFILLAGASAYMDEYWYYTKIGRDDKNFEFIAYSVIYFFIAYPAIYAISRKLSCSIKDTLKLNP
jgi:hypothetical protein